MQGIATQGLGISVVFGVDAGIATQLFGKKTIVSSINRDHDPSFERIN